MGSTRLPGKVLMELGGQPLLAFMLERIAGLDVDHLVVATSDLARDDAVADTAAGCGAMVVRGPEQDVLKRFAIAVRRFPAEAVVRLTADCPLADPTVIGAAIQLWRDSGADYVSNTLVRTFPIGLDVEVFSGEALLAAEREAHEPAEREHVTPFIYRRPERFQLRTLRSTDPSGDERWTIDTAQDLEFVRRIVHAMGARRDFAWKQILAVVGRQAVQAPAQPWLRPAVAADERRLFEWCNDPEAIQARRRGVSSTPTDSKWFEELLIDGGRPLWIGHVDGEPFGYVGMEVRAGQGQVRIHVLPERRGQRLGGKLLGLLQAHAATSQQVVALHDEVDAQNTRALRLFRSAGFKTQSEADGWVRVGWRC